MRIQGKIPLMILPNGTLFAEAIIPLDVFGSRYWRMLSYVFKSHRMFAVAMMRLGLAVKPPSRWLVCA